MSIKTVFASFALAAAVTTSVFGVCTVQHANMSAHSGMDLMLVSAMDMGCPLSKVADFQPLEKYSQADPGVFWRVITPVTGQLVWLRITPVNAEAPLIADQIRASSDIPITITSPPLAYAYSQGILNPKIFSIA